MICKYCKKEFTSQSYLNFHIKNTKYCLKIQSDINSDEQKNINEKCYICDKILANSKCLKAHLEKCTTIYNIHSILKKNKDNIESVENKTKQAEKDKMFLKQENEILKRENEILKRENDILKTDHECIQEIAKQPKNITNTNNKILNIITPLDLSSVDIIKNKINDNYKLDYIFSGQKGIAKFAFDHILKDDEGNLKYVCTDPSRQIFKYKDETGEVRKDVEAKKLTNFLVEGGIKHKAANIMNDWWTEETGIKNTDKFELLVDKAESLRIIDTDNNEFKKELITMTTV
jgi:hypothetical protein